MKIFFSGILSISATVLLLLVLSFYIFNFSDIHLLSIILGWVLSFLYVISGFILFYFALKFAQRSFGKIMIISIFGRLGLISIGIILSLKFITLNKEAFLIALFSFYLIFQILEVFVLNKVSIKGA